MHIAILETGRINPAIADHFPRYPDMFRSMFDAASPSATDDFPEIDLYLIVGERSCVNTKKNGQSEKGYCCCKRTQGYAQCQIPFGEIVK